MIVCRKVKESDEYMPTDCDAFIIDHKREANSQPENVSFFLSSNLQKEGVHKSTLRIADAVYDIKVTDVKGILTTPPQINIGGASVELTRFDNEYRLEGVTLDKPLFLSPVVWFGESLTVNLDSKHYKKGVTVEWSAIYISDCPQRRDLAMVVGLVDYGQFDVKYGYGFGILFNANIRKLVDTSQYDKVVIPKIVLGKDAVESSKRSVKLRLLAKSVKVK